MLVAFAALVDDSLAGRHKLVELSAEFVHIIQCQWAKVSIVPLILKLEIYIDNFAALLELGGELALRAEVKLAYD